VVGMRARWLAVFDQTVPPTGAQLWLRRRG
jgi:hypothetical protein